MAARRQNVFRASALGAVRVGRGTLGRLTDLGSALWRRLRPKRQAPAPGGTVPGAPAPMRWPWRLLRAAGIAFLLVAVAIMWFEDNFIFFPTRFPDGYWGDQARELPTGEEVWITTEDGVRLHGLWLPAEDPRAVVCFFHGNAGNLSHRFPFLAWLREERCAALAIDYRGYGRSDGSPTERGCYRDARAAYDWLRARGVPPASLVLWGRSLGSGVATDLALDATRPSAALILEAPFTNVKEMSRQVAGSLPLHWLLRSRFDTLGRAPKLRQPLWVVYGLDDRVVPPDHGRRIHAAAGSPVKWLFEVPRGTHDSAWEIGGAEMRRRLREFLAANVATPDDAVTGTTKTK